MSTSIRHPATFLPILFLALASQAAKFDLNFGAGYSASSAPALLTRDSGNTQMEKAVGTEFSGFHLTATLGIPLNRWFAIQSSLSGAFETGVAAHPNTTWSPGSNPLGGPLNILGGKDDAKRETYSFLAGFRFQDREISRRVNPWAYAMASWNVQYLELEDQDRIHGEIFYPETEGELAVIQSGPGLGLGLGADVMLYRGLGLRLGLEYLPFFGLVEHSLSLRQGHWFSGSSYNSDQSAEFEGGIIHQWRLAVGPRWSF